MNKRNAKLKPKILLVHNTVMWYTKPFFVRLSEIYDIKFIFTDMQRGKNMYGLEIFDESEKFDGMKYKILKRYLSKIYAHGIPFGLIKELFQGQYDIVVASLGGIEMFFCFMAAKLRQKPIIFWSGTWNGKGRSSERTLVSYFTKFIVQSSDAIVVPGTKHKEYVISLGASPDKVFIMPYASNIIIQGKDYENKERLKEKLNIGNKKVILYVGRLVKQKGVDYLIEAFSKLRKEMDDIVLLIVGAGESRTELELQSKNLGIEGNVYFKGFVSNAKLPPYYLLCDICVMPSITYGQADVWLRAVNDAMCAGKPVIATDAVGAAFDMIRGGLNGFMVPERDADALYNALKKILSEQELAKRMGEESKKIVEQGFKYEHMIKGFSRAVESIPIR
jgi:glycosyltransferase involved in cell wall biosynthesis